MGDLTISGRGFNEGERTLRFGPVNQDKGKKATLFLTAKGPYCAEVKPTVKLVDPPELAVSFDPPKSLKGGTSFMHMCRVEVAEGSPFVNRLGNTADNPPARIVIETNHPEIPELEIFVRYAVAN